MIWLMAKNIKIGLALVDDQKMRTLNKKYRGQDKAVSVLAFPYNDELPDGTLFLGEIVVNVDQARTEDDILERIQHGAKNLLKGSNLPLK
jgi:rRNA maturation RNase YbeY